MSKHVVWKEIFSVGVQVMDDQHKQFFKIADDIISLFERGDYTNAKLLDHATKLGDYALFHLGSEEEYFKEFKCDNMEQHFDAHVAFRRQVKDYISRIRKQEPDMEKLVEDMASFSANWLADHILTIDKGYTTCFHAHGMN